MSTSSALSKKIQGFNIALAGIQHHKRYILGVSTAVCLAGWLLVSMMPNQYQSSATVYADTRSILKHLLSGIAVHNDTDQGIQVISQTLLSRSNLEKIALKAELDLESETPEKYEKLLTALKSDIQMSGSSKSNVYTVSYSHHNPETAKKVVELTLKEFLDTSMLQNKVDSSSATGFLEKQIEDRKLELEAAEMALAKFKQENVGTLPQQGGGYYATLSTLRTQIEDLDINIAAKQAELSALRGTFLPSENPDGTAVVATPFDQRLNMLNQQLDQARLNFTDKHPAIKELTQQIESLKNSQKEAQSGIVAQASKGALTSSSGDKSDALQAFSLQISRLESDLSVLRDKKQSTEIRFTEMQKQIQVIPAIEAQLTGLQRDYEGSKKMYEELVRRLEQAKLSQNANENTSDVKFKTLEPPRVPLTPSGPPRIIMYVAVFVLGLSLGVGLAFMKSKLSGRVVNANHLAMIVGESKIIGQLLNQEHVKIIRKNRMRMLISIMWLSVITLCMLGLIVYEIKYGQPPGLLIKSAVSNILPFRV